MLRFRTKLGSERGNEWRCCFCLHVRTGTVLLGSWHLILHLMALACLAAIVRDPRMLEKFSREPLPMAEWGEAASALPTPLSNVEPSPNTLVRAKQQRPLIYHDVDMGALVTVCTLAITLMLIYGALRGKATHLLPFFCLQIFDFVITVLTATGYMCYLHSIKELVYQAPHVPFRAQLLRLPEPALGLIVLLAFMMAVFFKGYCIGIVWRCYKYLTMRSHAMHSLTPFVISGEGVMSPAPLCNVPPYSGPVPAPDYSSLLPDYDEAVKQTAPPPSYRAATLMATSDTVVNVPQNPPSSPPPPIDAPQATPPAASGPAPTAPAPAPAPANTVVCISAEPAARL